ncbi:MAG: exodeoxyribonuclease III [Planctomycetota bacterium]
MKITTWNVNGIRARLTHVVDFLREHEPDVLCLQETKVQDDLFPLDVLEDEGYEVTFDGQKGYNGVAILAAHEIENPVKGMPDDGPDADKRVLAASVNGFRILDLYVVNGQEVGAEKYDYKLDWLRRLRTYLDSEFAANEDVVVVGDFNVTLDDRDVHDPDWWRGKILCSDKERDAMRNVMAFGLEDSLRQHHDEAGIYTWWHYTGGSAVKDDGLRIDYVLSSKSAAARCTDVIVHKEERSKASPSDHVPVTGIYRDR